MTFHESTQHQISTEIRPCGATLIRVDRCTEVTEPVGAFCIIGHSVCVWMVSSVGVDYLYLMLASNC